MTRHENHSGQPCPSILPYTLGAMSTDGLPVFSGGLPESRAFGLADLVAYQDGTVVSRTIAKANGGTVTLFAFDRGQELSEHTAPFDALVQVLEGEVLLTIGGQAVPAGAGQIVRMPAHVPHAVHATARFKMLLILVREVPR